MLSFTPLTRPWHASNMQLKVRLTSIGSCQELRCPALEHTVILLDRKGEDASESHWIRKRWGRETVTLHMDLYYRGASVADLDETTARLHETLKQTYKGRSIHRTKMADLGHIPLRTSGLDRTTISFSHRSRVIKKAASSQYVNFTKVLRV